ncbi:hypothetical protein LOK74_17525 [Brevibacillus humidisoli]|uniref:hypothetical protein n=1 Tax=Brevibacillus humidisoli TaxID=2895522 RepID=UPI001E5D1879|nr:hypothetical protein [Brevibacillus humidisoli]UFJ39833.1 hypothetical protein LOK74_17525 [Brevibacillus humidisoli]
MLIIAGIVLVGVVIALIEVPRLVRNRHRKELWVFSCLLLFGVGLGIAKSLDVEIPNPLDWITALYKPANDLLTGLLK